MTDPATGAPLPDERVIDEAIVLLFAGYETTAAAANWAMTLHAERPDLQERLASGEPGLVERVVSETLRLRRRFGEPPDPDRFDPDRFLPEQARGRPGSAFLPFIVGPRHGLGMRLAALELHLLIEAFCRRFEIATVGTIEPDARLALRVRGGLPLDLAPRVAA